MTNYIYYLIIEPLVIILNVIFSLLNKLLDDAGSSVVFLSIIVNFMVLPLYKKAEAVQLTEYSKQDKMKPTVDHIKRVFKGDERYMMLQAYYRIEGYRPYYALIGLIPLIMQIPFFLSAYKVLSTSPYLNNRSFFAIEELSKPDGLLHIGGLSINVMPIIMTIINLIAAFLYSKNQTVLQKVQMIVLAVLFLVLLYNSPSGLVLYWTVNQVFSLVKNLQTRYALFTKRNPGLVFSIIILYFILLAIIFGELFTTTRIIVACILSVLSFAKILIEIFKVKKTNIAEKIQSIINYNSKHFIVKNISVKDIIIVEVCLTVLMGLCIPSAVICSSAAEFVDLSTGKFEINLLTYSATVYAGIFIIWGTIVFLLNENKTRPIYYGFICSLLVLFMANYFLFYIKTGFLYKDFSFDGGINYPKWFSVLNILACIILIAGLVFIMLKNKKIISDISIIICFSLIILFGYQSYKIVRSLKYEKFDISSASSDDLLTFTRTGQNVVVLMVDRAMSPYLPYIFEEKPELEKAFDGFVYYPNTVSFGKYTLWGVPSIYGGYEYTPKELNKRDTELLVDKYDESLKMLPKLFSDNNYNVTVTDPPWAGFMNVPDLSIYDDISNVKAYNLQGMYSERYNRLLGNNIKERQEINLTMYSLYRSVPVCIRELIYDEGDYLFASNINEVYTNDFIDSYSALDELPYITSYTDDNTNCLFMLQNAITHNPTVLDPPDYEVDGKIASSDIPWKSRTINGETININNKTDWASYCVNMLAYMELAEWLDTLKEKGVYDNTRIIIVADHGFGFGQFDNLIHPDGLDVESVNPLLMVKDFNTSGGLEVCDDLMTTADVATLATQEVINEPINPYTGKEINDNAKKEGDISISDADSPHPISHINRTTYITEGSHWWTVQDNIFDMNNWRIIGDGEED